MKSFFLKIWPYLLLLTTVLGYTEYFIKHAENDMTYKKSLALKGDYSGIILGSSHNYFGILPSEMNGNFINLAYPGQSLNYDQHILENFAKINDSTTIIVELSFHSLPYALHLSKGGIEHALYNHNWDYPIWYDNNILKKCFVSYSNGLSNSLRRSLKSIIKTNYTMVRCDKEGAGKKEKKEGLEKTAIIDCERHNSLYKKNEFIIERNKKHFDKIVNLGKKNMAKTVVIIPPLHQEYLKRISNKNLTIFNQYIAQLKSKNVEIWDCMELYKNEDALFADSDHLNADGAKRFSKYLSDKLINDENK